MKPSLQISSSSDIAISSLTAEDLRLSIGTVDHLEFEDSEIGGDSSITVVSASNSTFEDIDLGSASTYFSYMNNVTFGNVTSGDTIALYDSNDVVLSYISVKGSDYRGLELIRIRHFTVRWSDLTMNLNAGIGVMDSEDGVIAQCVIDENINYGILVQNSTGVEIWNNTFYANHGYAIHMDASSQGNLVHRNSFMRNHYTTDHFDPSRRQAADFGQNLWNDSLGGNFWLDWTTPDEDGDGIVDNPYPLKGGARDMLPLVNPPGTPVPELPSALTTAIVVTVLGGMLASRRRG